MCLISILDGRERFEVLTLAPLSDFDQDLNEYASCQGSD